MYAVIYAIIIVKIIIIAIFYSPLLKKYASDMQ